MDSGQARSMVDEAPSSSTLSAPLIKKYTDEALEAAKKAPRSFKLTGFRDPNNPRVLLNGCHGNGGQDQKDTAQFMNELLPEERPEMGIFLGDNVYDNGVNSPLHDDFNRCFHHRYGTGYMADVPIWLSLGNHDADFHSTNKLNANYYTISGKPAELQQQAHSFVPTGKKFATAAEILANYKKPVIHIKDLNQYNMPNDYYDLEIEGGNKFFIVLDSNFIVRDYLNYIHDVNGAHTNPQVDNQIKWLIERMKYARENNKEVIFCQHHPIRTSGKRVIHVDSSHYLFSEEIQEAKLSLQTQSDSYNEFIRLIYEKLGFINSKQENIGPNLNATAKTSPPPLKIATSERLIFTGSEDVLQSKAQGNEASVPHFEGLSSKVTAQITRPNLTTSCSNLSVFTPAASQAAIHKILETPKPTAVKICAAHDHFLSIDDSDEFFQLTCGTGGGDKHSCMTLTRLPFMKTHLKRNGFTILSNNGMEIYTTARYYFNKEKENTVRYRLIYNFKKHAFEHSPHPDSEVENLRISALNICAAALEKLKYDEINMPIIEKERREKEAAEKKAAAKKQGWGTFFYNKTADALNVVKDVYDAAKKHLYYDPDEDERFCIFDMQAFFSQYNLPDYKACMEYITELNKQLEYVATQRPKGNNFLADLQQQFKLTNAVTVPMPLMP